MSTCWKLKYSSSSPRSSNISAISGIIIATSTATITAIDHTTLKEVEKVEGIFDRAARGYCNMRLPNGKIFLNRRL